MNVLLVADGGPAIGAGHIKRIEALAQAFRDSGARTEILFGGIDVEEGAGDETARLIPEAGFVCRNLPEVTKFAVVGGFDFVLLDVVNRETHAAISAFGDGLSALQARVSVGVFDSHGADSLREVLPRARWAWDLLIAPYVGESGHDEDEAAMLLGPGYYPLAPENRVTYAAPVRNEAKRILVTFGGSDPQAASVKTLEVLGRLPGRFGVEVRCIVGPYFSTELRTTLQEMASAYRGIELVYKPSGLGEHFQWCDIAISASGLTKYELAAAGVPALLLSLDMLHDGINRAFMTAGTALDMGIVAALDAERMLIEVARLLDDTERRQILARRGRDLVDGAGAERIVARVRDLLTADRDVASGR